MNIRRWHSYLGLLIAPSVLFFSVTGAWQLFGLHEGHGNYQPPALIEKLSSVHKDQVFAPGHHGGPPEAASEQHEPEATKPADQHQDADHHDDDDNGSFSTTLLKAYFLIVAIALTISTCFGIWMGVTQLRRKSTALILLAVGTVVPIALLLI